MRDELAASAARYAELYDLAPAGYLTLDCAGAITRTNPVCARLLGMERDAVAGRRLGEFVAEADRPVFVLATATRSSGSEDWVHTIGKPDLEHRRIYGFFQDITERKQAEDAMRASEERLVAVIENLSEGLIVADHQGGSSTGTRRLWPYSDIGAWTSASANSPSLPTRLDRETQQLEDGLAILDKCTNDVRTLSYLLHPPRLEEAGLVGAIRHYAEGFGERTGIAMNLELPEDPGHLTEEAELVLFRVMQESLGNIHRHAHSATANIRITRDDSTMVSEIRDTGCGFPPPSDPSQDGILPRLGMGIPAKRGRLLQIGGHLEIQSGPRGTTVVAMVATMIEEPAMI